MGRPPLAYQHDPRKYYAKRPKITSDQFDSEDTKCPKCSGTHFFAEKVFQGKYAYYKTYGYKTTRVLWKIRCMTHNCQEPYAVILKPEHRDSAGE